MLVNRLQAIVEDSFYTVWNSPIGKSDFIFVLKRMGKWGNLRMLYILASAKRRENHGQTSFQTLTPGAGSLMPPAILRGVEVISRKNPCSHRAAWPWPQSGYFSVLCLARARACQSRAAYRI